MSQINLSKHDTMDSLMFKLGIFGGKSQSRIDIHKDTMQDLLVKMCDGNPGALTAMCCMGPKNPTDALPFWLMLDVFGIYGTDIYVLFSDICDRDVNKMKAVLLGVQTGLFTKETLQDAAHRQDYSGKAMVPVNDLYELIKLEFPNLVN